MRLLVYLLSHKKVTAKVIAARFGVSQRTVVRDMENLNQAGVPIAATSGVGGGYRILDTFELPRFLTTQADFELVLTALKSLNSAYDSQNLTEMLEKAKLLSRKKLAEQRIFVDFSVVKEGVEIPEKMALLSQALQENRVLRFAYHAASGENSLREVRPLALNYRWYAWYLLAFDLEKSVYRIFKLTRLRNLVLTAGKFSEIPENLEEVLKKQWGQDQRPQIQVKLACRASVREEVEEYLKPKMEQVSDNGDFICTFSAVPSERMWFSLLLGFDESVKVLEPDFLVEKIRQTAKKITARYDS